MQDLTLNELENVLMMISFARRYGHYDHEFARNAEKKLNEWRKELIKEKAPLFASEINRSE